MCKVSFFVQYIYYIHCYFCWKVVRIFLKKIIPLFCWRKYSINVENIEETLTKVDVNFKQPVSGLHYVNVSVLIKFSQKTVVLP